MRISDWSSDVCSSDLLLAHTEIISAAVPGHDHRRPFKLIPRDVDDEAVPFEPCMAGLAVARVRIEFAADIVGGDSEALKQEKRQQLGTMAAGTTREMTNADGSPTPIVASVQRRSQLKPQNGGEGKRVDGRVDTGGP